MQGADPRVRPSGEEGIISRLERNQLRRPTNNPLQYEEPTRKNGISRNENLVIIRDFRGNKKTNEKQLKVPSR